MDDFGRMRASLVERGLICAISGELTDAGHAYCEKLIADLAAQEATARSRRSKAVRWVGPCEARVRL